MTHNTFFTSDLHLGHDKTTDGTFKRKDGSNLRPFSSVEEMDQTIIDNWNAIVGEHDRVYVLGDCVMRRRDLWKFKALKGKKRLVRGNHDVFKLRDYMDVGFEDIYGVKVMDECILSHIPLHEDSITKRFRVNVHGHLHAEQIMTTAYVDIPGIGQVFSKIPNPRYLNVCVEHTDYTPLSYEELRDRMRQQFEDAGIDPEA